MMGRGEAGRDRLAWYRDVIGCKVEQQHERDGKLAAVGLSAGDARFMINQDDGAKGWDRTKGEGFALMFTTSQSIDAVAERIKANGGTLDMEPADMPWGARIITLKDPTGFKLVISSPRG